MENFDGIDLDSARRVAGNGFYYLMGDIARLHSAVISYARDFMINRGFTYCVPPFMIRSNVVTGVMSFAEDVYKRQDASSETVSGGYYVLVPYAQGIKKMDDVRDTVTINSILTTSDQAYSKTDLNSDTLEKEDGDEAGPFDLGVSITETLDDDKETQIVYYSTSNPVSYTHLQK